jgi:26S proteasome regulatory subunit N6
MRLVYGTLRIYQVKAAKLIRQLIDSLSHEADSRSLQILICEECTEWCHEEKRTFLRHRVQIRLAMLYLEEGKYQAALDVAGILHSEVKKLDDKLLLVEILVVEAKINISLNNIPKAKVSLTAAKSNANAIHCPFLLQAEIDSISGIINAQEKDYKTAFSYFNEAFDSLHQNHEKQRATRALRYMLLSKIMADQPKEVEQIVNSKVVAMEYAGEESTEALLAIAKAQRTRSIEIFENVVRKYEREIACDPVISLHIKDLNERLVEQNLSRILEPYSRVEIEHVARLLKLSPQRVQSKLSDMILDNKLKGTLDQGIGVLILFADEEFGSIYDDLLVTIDNTSNCIDSLFEKSKTIVTSSAAAS